MPGDAYRFVHLGPDSLTLEVTGDRSGELRLRIGVLDTLKFSTPPSSRAGGATVFRLQDIPDRLLTIRAVHPGPTAGLWASVAGLAMAFLLLASWVAGDRLRSAFKRR